MSGPLWTIGQKLEIVSFDEEYADLRELDGTYAEVLNIDTTDDPYGLTKVATIYGEMWLDPFNLREPS